MSSPTTDPPDSGRLDAALSAYGEYLGALMRGEGAGLEEFAARRPEMREELHSIHTHIARTVDRDGRRASLFQRLAERYGRAVVEPPELADRTDLEGGSPLGAQVGGRYRVERKIAEGGMGAILRVWDEDLRRHLAMKVVVGSETATEAPATRREPTEQQIARFLEEAQVTGQLDHPGIVPVHELGLDAEGGVFFTMRLVKGRELREAIRDGRERTNGWTPMRVVSTLQRVCEAMAYAHSRGVLHRDLKPANVMVGRFGETYVMDWGLARVIGAEETKNVRLAGDPITETEIHSFRKDSGDSDPGLMTMDGDVVGTPAYMPPEQARGELEAMGPFSDVYSVGAMLYELLVGHAPYSPKSERPGGLVIWRRLLDGPPPRVRELAPDAPPELAAIAERAMARETADRYPDMTSLADDLRAYLENRVVRAYRSGALVAIEKWIGRNRKLAAATAALVLLGVASLVSLLALQGLRATERSRNLEEHRAVALIADVPRLMDFDPDVAGERAAWLAAARELTERGPRVEAEVARLAAKGTPQPGVAREAAAEELEQRRAAFAEERRSLPARAAEVAAQGRDLEAELEILDRELERIARTQATARVRGGRLAAVTFDESELEAEYLRRGRLLADLRRLGARPGGWIEWLEELDARAAASRRLSLDASASVWGPAAAAVAADPRFGGFELVPQLGLVPLGADSESGLQEFWHVASGARPVRGERGFELEPGTGLVLVLIPPGSGRFGAQAGEPNAPGYDPAATPAEGPVLRVEIERPYFLSKYELTQGQWLHLTGEAPARFKAANQFMDHRRLSRLHPVEHVSWRRARRVLHDVGLELPTELLWEWAARGGARGPGYGDGPLSVAANVYDVATGELGGEDGWTTHGPVDLYAPNPFGLHQVLGGIAELTRDPYDPDPTSYRPEFGADLMRLPGRYTSLRGTRGGSFREDPLDVRASWRRGVDPDGVFDDVGVRPFRPVLQDARYPDYDS